MWLQITLPSGMGPLLVSIESGILGVSKLPAQVSAL